LDVFRCELKNIVEPALEDVRPGELVRRATGVRDDTFLIADDDDVDRAFQDLARQLPRSENFLAPLLFGEIGRDQDETCEIVEFERTDRAINGHLAVGGGEGDFFLYALAPSGAQQRLQKRMRPQVREFFQPVADDLLQRPPQHRGESLVAIEDPTLGRQRGGALVHLLEQQAIRMVGAAQRVDLIAFGPAYDQRVDLAAADRFERFFGFAELGAKKFYLISLLRHLRHAP